MGLSARLLLVFLSTITLVNSAPVLMVVGPDILHHGREETISLNLLNHGQNVQVEIFLQDFPQRTNTFSQKTVTVQSDRAMLTTVRVLPEDLPETDPPMSHVYLKVRAAAINFDKEMKVLVSSQSHLVFIQTDKPLYTPRQKVNVRVFTMDHDMKPVDVPIKLDLLNPQGVIVERTNLNNENGINTYYYDFPAISMVGNWSWAARFGHEFKENVTARFEVKEYELPSFQTQIFPPQVILPTDTHISGYVQATHSYGEPVSGFATVKLHVKKDGVLFHFVSLQQRLNNENGRYYFDFPLAELAARGAAYTFPALQDALLYVEATVREISTGKKMTAVDQKAIFSSSSYKIGFERSSRYFKPSLPYVVRLNTKYANGLPAPNVPVRVTAVATNRGGVKSDVSSFVVDGQALVNRVTSDDRGRARHTLNISPDTISIQITVRTMDDEIQDGQQGRGILTITSYNSPSNSYIMIRPKTEVAQVGIMEAEVFMTNTAQASRLTYMVISRGKIMRQRTLDRSAGTFTTLHIPISAAMSPSIRLFVYYVHPSGEVLADSIWVDVQNVCDNELAVSVHPQRPHYSPSDNVEIRVTGQPQSQTQVALLAVDKAVFFLNDKQALTRQKMFGRLEEQDQGCTPGGGQHGSGVFKDSGMLGLTNARLQLSTRSSVQCPQQNRRRRSLVTPSLSNLPECCQQGRLWASGASNITSCGESAEELSDATLECKNVYFVCCKRFLRRNTTQLEEERNERTGRINSGQAVMSYKYRLIRTNEDDVPVRSKFDESWMFYTRPMREDGQLSQTVTLKDSITTWMIQAVGISPTKGMCVAHPQSIKVFKEVFLKVNLPYSAVRMEQLEVKATLYNYADEAINAILNMEGDEKVCYGARPGDNTEDIMIEVPARESRVLSWPVIPLEVGPANIKVKAFTSRGSDIVERKLVVVPPGKKMHQTITVVLDPNKVLTNRERRSAGRPLEAVEGAQVEPVPLKVPSKAIPGSEHCTITATGTVMGPVVEQLLAGDGLNHLIQLPRGCGEQTLIRLGPLVYVAKYLRSSNQIGDKEQQIHQHIRSGVQHELQYRRPGGGFAVWTDRKPSTWLTAFAVKIFSQARSFDVLTEDPSRIICTAVEWMSQQQRANGVYYDGYKVHHREMTGGVQGDTTFTAYVLVGMLQSRCEQEPRVARSMAAAIAYLEGQIDSLTRPYAAALVAYALSLANSAHKQRANDRLKGMAHEDAENGYRYWPANQAAFQGTRPYWYARRPLAIEIETAAYAVLTQLKLNDVNYANPVIHWLLAQRQGNGAYISTQDTVLALEALSEYTLHTADSTLNLQCRVELQSELVARSERSLDIVPENAEVRQRIDISSYLGGDMVVRTSGEGVGQLQVEMTYNIASTDEEECHFDLRIQVREHQQQSAVPDIEAEDDEDMFEDFEDEADPQPQVQQNQAGSGHFRNPLHPVAHRGNQRDRSRIGGQNPERRGRNADDVYTADVIICTQYNGENDTGFAILDVGIFTGFEAVTDTLNEMKNRRIIDNYEVTDRSVQVYLSSVPKNDQKCLTIPIKKEHAVGMTHPVAVTIYDYYEPSISCTKFYHAEGQQHRLQTICDQNQEVCSCAESKCGKCYSSEAYDERPWDSGKMMGKTCSAVYIYALRITVENINFDVATELITVRVDYVLKRAQRPLAKGDVITLHKKSACTCPFMEPGKSYYLISQEGNPFVNENGEPEYKYIIDDASYVVERMNKANYRRGTAEWEFAQYQHLWFRTMKRSGGCRT